MDLLTFLSTLRLQCNAQVSWSKPLLTYLLFHAKDCSATSTHVMHECLAQRAACPLITYLFPYVFSPGPSALLQLLFHARNCSATSSAAAATNVLLQQRCISASRIAAYTSGDWPRTSGLSQAHTVSAHDDCSSTLKIVVHLQDSRVAQISQSGQPSHVHK